MGQFFHDSRFLTFLPKVVKVGCVGLPIADKPCFGVNAFEQDMGLTLVCEVFVNGNDIHLSLCFVERLDGPVEQYVVACEQAFRDLGQEDSSVYELVH
jgi:hypothetical protein